MDERILTALFMAGLCFITSVAMCLSMGIWSQEGAATFWRWVAIGTVAIPAMFGIGYVIKLGLPVALYAFSWVASQSFIAWGIVAIICLLGIIVVQLSNR